MSVHNDPTSSDESNPIPQPDAFANWDEKDRAYRCRASELLPLNKTAVFDTLVNGNIKQVVVRFDGYGDSGQIEEIEAKAGDEIVELPEERIEILDPVWGSAEVERQTHTIREAIEHMAYAFLRETHEGWEINDGAYGDFMFDVAERTITLDYNERFTSSENYTHEF